MSRSAEILIQRCQVHALPSPIQRAQRLDLGREGEALFAEAVEERLLTQMIARRQQAPALHVPQREREHAAQMLEQPVAIALVQRRG